MMRKKISFKPDKKFEFKLKLNLKNVLFWGLIIAIIASFFFSFRGETIKTEEVPLSQVMSDIKQDKVKEIEVVDDQLNVRYEEDKILTSRKEPGASFTEILQREGIKPEKVEIKIKDTSFSKAWVEILATLLPLGLMILFFFFIFRQARGAQDSIFSFGRSRAKLFAKGRQPITFNDVAGVIEAKKELEEIVDFLKHPGKYRRLGARTPKGVLLVGPSGTGKTLLARAIAGEAKVPFFSMAGSEFMEMLVGVGASRVRDLFSTAKKAAPCLPGETIITLADGYELTIEEMFRKKMVGQKVVSMVKGKTIEAAKVIAITRRRFDILCQIKTMHSSVKATPNHLFPVFQEGRIIWKRADKLHLGDYLAYPRKLPTRSQKTFLLDFLPSQTRVYLKGENSAGKRRLKSRKLADWQERNISKIDFLALGKGGWTDSKIARIPEYLNWDLAYLIGLLMADGNFSKTNRFNIGFINTEEQLHRKVKEIVSSQFGYLPKTYLDSASKKRDYSRSNRNRCWVTHINNKIIRVLIEGLIEKLLVLPEDLIIAFLSGYFDGDGYVADQKSLPKIVLSAWNKKTNRLLRSLLHRLGVVTYGSQSANIEITGKEAVAQLRDKLVSFHPQKMERLTKLNLEGRSGSRLDGIPIGSFLKEVRESLGISQWALAMGGKISDYEQGFHVPSRGSLRKVIYKMEELMEKNGIKTTEEFLRLKKIVFGEIAFSKICQISFREKPSFVYDLCLNDHHNFVANSLFVHNCIIFIDEIESIGRHRGLGGFAGGHGEQEQTLNQILVEMDGFTPNDRVIILAATNRPDLLDPALTRPGRFDRRIALDMPDIEDREAIIKIHARGKPFVKGVSWKRVAKRTVGFSGADIENMLNEAAILAARYSKKTIDMDDIEEAATKVKLGPEKKRLQSDEEKKMTAYHEAGHAIVTHMLPQMDPVHRVSIVSRGLAMGFTLIPPKRDRYTETKSHLLETVTSLLGGRAAEEMIFNEFTAGAASDIDQATRIARRMVVDFGMSELGPVYLGPQLEATEYGRTWVQPTEISPETQAKVDREIKRIVDEGYKEAVAVLKKNKKKLDIIAKKLLDQETIDEGEFEKLIGKKKK